MALLFSSLPRWWRAVLVLSGSLLASTAFAAGGGFTASLSEADRSAAGLDNLSPVERNSLDQLVAGDLLKARQPDYAPLADTFVSRRNAAERQLAGLERLTPAQIFRLNELVAAALAARPKPKERPRLHDSDVFTAVRPPEIHGSVSLAFGVGSGGRNFRASSLWLDYSDPNTGLSIGVGIDNVDGRGLYPAYYDYGYDAAAPFAFDGLYNGLGRDGFTAGEGQSFECRAGSAFVGAGHWHH